MSRHTLQEALNGAGAEGEAPQSFCRNERSSKPSCRASVLDKLEASLPRCSNRHCLTVIVLPQGSFQPSCTSTRLEPASSTSVPTCSVWIPRYQVYVTLNVVCPQQKERWILYSQVQSKKHCSENCSRSFLFKYP